ncbi:spectrin binding protein [Aureococcus anophagefferens]|uniref:Spectrin binding protein n=1 Tax=Aureococcus anophagefferens TaxID=44056 RepID=A0ABR1G5E5_AURAN
MRAAIGDGDFDRALRLVARGCFAIDAAGPGGETVAVARRRHALAELLLLRGVEPLGPCDGALFDGADVLPGATRRRRQRADARAAAERARRLTPFFVAVETGDLDAVRIFLDQRVAVFDVDAPRPDGSTALMAALARGHVAVAPRSAAAGRGRDGRGLVGRSALERACFDHASAKAELRTVAVALDAARALAAAATARARRRADERLTDPWRKRRRVAQRDAGAVAALLDAGADALAPIDGGPATPLLRACGAPDLATLRGRRRWRPRGVGAAPTAPTGRRASRCWRPPATPTRAAASWARARTPRARTRRAGAPLGAPRTAATQRVPRFAALAPRDRAARAAVLDAPDRDGLTPLHAAARVGARAALALVHGHAAAATQLAAMSHAVMDGDFAECIRLHRNGNWPLDWTVGNDDLDDAGGLASSTRTEVIGELEPVEDVEELT